MYSKTRLRRPLKKKTKIGFQDQLLLNTGQKYCRMLQGEHSAILTTFIELPFVIKIFVLSILEQVYCSNGTDDNLHMGRLISAFVVSIQHIIIYILMVCPIMAVS